ncbi:hypothetical protein Q9966_006547 [Columba livia]|nr:hypothetical protein Q9966_006547 [Columba livia]
MSLRLVDGPDTCSGRLEVFHNGSWATVCDDGWDMSDAAVVCRQLGCGRALWAKYDAFFGQGTGAVLLDEVACSGDESSLEQCSHQGLGMHDCYHKEDAGVICEVPLEPTTSETTAVSPTPEPEDITTSPAEDTTSETAAPTEPTTPETPVTNSSTPSVSTAPETADTTPSPAEDTTSETAAPTEPTTPETPVTNSSTPSVSTTPDIADTTPSPAEDTTSETTAPTESTTAETPVTNSSTPSVSPAPKAADATMPYQKPAQEPINPVNLAYLPKYMRLMLLRYLIGQCGLRRPGMPSIKLQGCVRDPTCGNYYSPGQRILQFKFRGPIYSRSCLRCRVLGCNRYNHPFQRYWVYKTRGKRSTSDPVIIIISQ